MNDVDVFNKLPTAVDLKAKTAVAEKLVTSLSIDLRGAAGYGRNSIEYDLTRVEPGLAKRLLDELRTRGYAVKLASEDSPVGDPNTIIISW